MSEAVGLENPTRWFSSSAAVATSLLLLAGCAAGRSKYSETNSVTSPAAQSENKVQGTGRKAGEIVTQPARDVGVARTNIPPVLAKASEDPYSLQGMASCADLNVAMRELNDVLGPDFASADDKQENRAGKLAEAGGKTIVNALIPFRALVREISGAAPAKRRLEAAIDSGYARRGFLRGVQRARNCPR